MIRASAPNTLGWGSFVLLKIDCVRVARGGSLSTLHRNKRKLKSTTSWFLHYVQASDFRENGQNNY